MNFPDFSHNPWEIDIASLLWLKSRETKKFSESLFPFSFTWRRSPAQGPYLLADVCLVSLALGFWIGRS